MRSPNSGPTRREALLCIAAAWLLAVVLTWPIAARLATAGRLDTGDGRFSIWNVAWVAHALTTNPWQLYNANIFHPNENALAFSEANLFAGALAVPVWALTRSALAASNWTILCSFALSFMAMYALVRRLTGSRSGAALAALHFAYAPFVLAHIPHVQLLMTFGLPTVLLKLHDFVGQPGWRAAFWLGAAMALQGLACGYYGIFGGLIAGFGVVWFGIAARRWRDWRYWTMAASAAAVALLLIGPFFAPYVAVQEAGFERTLDEARMYSAGWRSYLVSPLWNHRWIVNLIRETGMWREVLFPGLLPLVFTGVAVARGLAARGSSPVPMSRRVIGFYLALAGLGLWASLGPDAGLYLALHETMPFFSMLRAPARFGLIVTMALAILGGAGFASLERILSGRTRRLAIAGVLLLAVARSSVGGLALTEIRPVPLAYARLASLPRGAVAEFPFWASSADRHRHTEYMLWSTYHWQPLINGYSDHIPADWFEDLPRLAAFPSDDAWRALRDRGARYVVVHWHAIDDAGKQTLAEAIRGPLLQHLRPVVDEPDITLYEIVSWP
jgi:hypothetical protein